MDVGEVADDLVGFALHPVAQRVGPVQAVGRVGVEDGDGLLDRRARLDLLGDLLHLRGDPGELLLAPTVGHLQVDHRADEVPRVQGVALAPARVGFRGDGGQFRLEEVSEPPVCRPRGFRSHG